MPTHRLRHAALGCALATTVAGCRTNAPLQTIPLPSVPGVFAPGIISDANEQWRITFSPDGRMAYFAESDGFFPQTRKATIHVTQFANGRWTEPRVAPFSGTYSDIDPFITPDGRRMYFSSIRPVNGATRGDIDLWYMDRVGEGWGEPVRLGDEVNSTGDELYPSASSDGTLYFASGPAAPQAGKHYDIYSAARSGRGFLPRVALSAAVNTVPGPTDPNVQSAWEFNPEVSANGNMLLFTSLRPGHGFGDLYVSHRRNGEWTQAVNLGPTVNTAADEFHPTLARDGRALYFVRRIPERGNFYVVATASVPALKR